MGRSERHTDAFGQIAAPDRHARTPMCGPSAYKSRSACASCISGRLSCRLGVPLTASPHVEPTAERAAKALVLTPRPAPPPFVPPPVPPTMTILGGGVHRGTSSLTVSTVAARSWRSVACYKQRIRVSWSPACAPVASGVVAAGFLPHKASIPTLGASALDAREFGRPTRST